MDQTPEQPDPQTEDFIRRVKAVAPDLSEEQLADLRRAVAGPPPAKPRRRITG